MSQPQQMIDLRETLIEKLENLMTERRKSIETLDKQINTMKDARTELVVGLNEMQEEIDKYLTEIQNLKTLQEITE